MAYPLTTDELTLFSDSNLQTADISFFGSEEELQITEDDIVSGGLGVSRYCLSGSKIEIGSAIASEVSLVLNNNDGKFDGVKFEGAELFIRIGTKDWEDVGNLTYVDWGYFTVDRVPRKLSTITVTALDRMVRFDKVVDRNELIFPMQTGVLLTRICDICNVDLGTSVGSLLNNDYSVSGLPDDGVLTYRQLLSFICEITGTCAFIDWNGELILKWYTPTTYVLDPSIRYSSDLQENAVTLSGVRIKTDDEEHLVGDDSYAINIESNVLIKHDVLDLAESLYTKLNGFSYTPFSASTLPIPHLYPLDMITYTDIDDISYDTIITDYSFVLNGSVAMSGKGETATRDGYASANPLTRRETAIINSLIDAKNESINANIMDNFHFNELISNALGLYMTETGMPPIVYLHDKQALEDSVVIFTMGASGIAWTNTGWNSGSPIWQYGATAAGFALFKKLSAEGISVARSDSPYRVEITPETFTILYGDMEVTKIEKEEMSIPRAIFTQYAEFGRIRIAPHVVGTDMLGTNIIFVDERVEE